MSVRFSTFERIIGEEGLRGLAWLQAISLAENGKEFVSASMCFLDETPATALLKAQQWWADECSRQARSITARQENIAKAQAARRL